MATTLQGKRIAVLAADGVERVELERPRDAVHQAGGHTDLLSPKTGEIRHATTTSTRPAHSP